MPKNLTDVDTFTDPIQAPADGDLVNSAIAADLAPQGLSNRTRNLKNRVDLLSSVFVAGFAGTSVGDDTVLTLTELHNVGGHTLDGNDIEVAAAGKYKITVQATLLVLTSGSQAGVNVRINGLDRYWMTTDFPSGITNKSWATVFYEEVVVPANERISLTAHANGTNVTYGSSNCRVMIERIAD